jgi:NAD(P)-dependent dehydrogenase (short-subunit alcohol dehydrogenase family)
LRWWWAPPPSGRRTGATRSWRTDGRIDDSDLPVALRWGVGGAIAQKFAAEGFLTVLTTRAEANASALAAAIRDQGGASMVVELDLVSERSIAAAFRRIREEAGDPEVLVYNAGYLEGRDLPPEKELLEHVPLEILTRRCTSPAAAPSWWRRRCCRRCASAAWAPSSSPTTPAPCAARSAGPESRCTTRGR